MSTHTVHLLIVIVHDMERLPDLLQAWREIGVPGATILTSTGAYRSTWLKRIGLGAIDRYLEQDEGGQRTLLVAIEDEELLSRSIAEAERVMDGFDRPHSGLLLVLPVAQVRGLHKLKPRPAAALPQSEVLPDWAVRRDTPIGEVTCLLNLKPAIVQADTPLHEVARVMLLHPNTHLACVVDEHERLIGVLDLHTLADDLFFHIMPEHFLSEITDLEEMMAYAQRSIARTARDAMHKAVWVKRAETVRVAFKRMHENKLPGLPVVDENYRVTGYCNLLALMASFLSDLGQGEESVEEQV